MSFQAKNDQVLQRQLKVQRLVIPFTITANATPASVVIRNDEPSVLFIKSEGVDQITAALASGETATYSVSPNDANGIINIYVKIDGDDCDKVCRASVVSRTTGAAQPVKLGDADGISSVGNIMLTMDSTVDFSTTNFDGCLEVEYIVSE
jgi:hypothetical protein